ncbi:hypothetical protein PR003_g5310 [Phytophthora rubi]|uniref:Uncharacterized protein n=1 Tax=Phytophthora rubi TaxID=129364 RepID=A0A6A4FJV0_9STRA|nr:hypothetical protein PR003_g5310 [Phytophthora rubi]
MNMSYYSVVISDHSSLVCSFVLPWGKYPYFRHFQINMAKSRFATLEAEYLGYW